MKKLVTVAIFALLATRLFAQGGTVNFQNGGSSQIYFFTNLNTQ
jgi:hypothetical protein